VTLKRIAVELLETSREAPSLGHSTIHLAAMSEGTTDEQYSTSLLIAWTNTGLYGLVAWI
jgi:hypothetical protein